MIAAALAFLTVNMKQFVVNNSTLIYLALLVIALTVCNFDIVHTVYVSERLQKVN